MTDVILLVLYAAVVSCGTRRLADRDLFAESPRLGILVWLTSLWSTVTALVLAAALAALDSFPIRDMIVDAVRSCLFVLSHYWTISPVAIVGSVVAVGGVLWLVSNAARLLLATRAARRSHRVTLAMVGRNGRLGVTVIDHPSVNIYCVPGDGGRVVVTSGALEALSPRQLAAVVAHERAHLSGRHHLITTAMQVLTVSFPFLPSVRAARRSVAFLVERIADEAACRVVDRHHLAAALVTVGSAPAPGAALGAGGHGTVRRVQLLLAPRGVTLSYHLIGWTIVVLLMAVPLALTTTAMTGLAWTDHCFLTSASAITHR